MRVIALDVGDRRIGVAAGDTISRVAVPVTVLTRRGTAADWEAVVHEARQRDAERIIVGMPLSLNGRAGPQAAVTEAFIDQLRQHTSIPIETWDERFSTFEAEHRLREAREATGRRRSDRASSSGSVDAAAAAIILQSYLDG